MRYLVLGLIVALLVMRLLRTRWAGKLLGISRRVLEIAHLVLLLVTALIAGIAEEWVLLGVVGVLLIWGGLNGGWGDWALAVGAGALAFSNVFDVP